MPRCEDRAAPTVQKLLDCVTTTLAACGRAVCRAYVAPGANAAWDKCDCTDGACGGTAFVVVNGIVPILGNDQGGSVQACAWEYELTAVVTVLRCAKTLTGDGQPPTPAELDEEAVGILKDAALLRESIVCCWPNDAGLDKGDWKMGSWTSLGPEGGCVGGAQTVTFRFSECRCS